MATERELRLSMEAVYALLRKSGLITEDESVRRIRVEDGKLIIVIVR